MKPEKDSERGFSPAVLPFARAGLRFAFALTLVFTADGLRKALVCLRQGLLLRQGLKFRLIRSKSGCRCLKAIFGPPWLPIRIFIVGNLLLELMPDGYTC